MGGRRRRRDRLIGYPQAKPADAATTYYVENTAIARNHQWRGLVKLLMDRLYADVRAAGARYIERDAAIANGYADKIVRSHATDNSRRSTTTVATGRSASSGCVRRSRSIIDG